MRLWKRARGWLLLFAVVIGLFFGLLYVFLAVSAARQPDYGKMPPAQVFTKILGYPPPPGVTHLRAEGKEALFGQTTVWLTFDLTDAALASMLKHGSHGANGAEDPMTGNWAVETIRQTSRSFSRRQAERMRRVGWGEVEKITDPQLYLLPAVNPDIGRLWGGWLIVDRKRRRAYAQAYD